MLCAICLQECNIHYGATLDCCSHHFHFHCNSTWICYHNNTCPICRRTIDYFFHLDHTFRIPALTDHYRITILCNGVPSLQSYPVHKMRTLSWLLGYYEHHLSNILGYEGKFRLYHQGVIMRENKSLSAYEKVMDGTIINAYIMINITFRYQGHKANEYQLTCSNWSNRPLSRWIEIFVHDYVERFGTNGSDVDFFYLNTKLTKMKMFENPIWQTSEVIIIVKESPQQLIMCL